MNSASSQSLLRADDPSPVRVTNPDGASSFLLIGDHAGNLVPGQLGSLGVSATEMVRHIAWDIGIAALGEKLADLRDAPFISQRYSRLVIDCNRDPAADDAIPETSDGTPVPANKALSATDRLRRIEAIHTPYHTAIANKLARRDAARRETVLVALHSFTPSMQGQARPWQIGILYSGGDERFARAMLRTVNAIDDLVVGDNQPYAMDGIDYTVPHHAFPTGRPYVEIEIRQDLLSTQSQIEVWADLLGKTLATARGVLESQHNRAI